MTDDDAWIAFCVDLDNILEQLPDELVASFGFPDRGALTVSVNRAIAAYHPGWIAPAQPETLDRVIALSRELEDAIADEHFHSWFATGTGGDGGALFDVGVRLTAMRDEIDKARRKRGRPATEGELRAAMKVLLAFWLSATGEKPTCVWKSKGFEPLSSAAVFVHRVMTRIAGPKIGPRLPGAMRVEKEKLFGDAVKKKRRKATKKKPPLRKIA